MTSRKKTARRALDLWLSGHPGVPAPYTPGTPEADARERPVSGRQERARRTRPVPMYHRPLTDAAVARRNRLAQDERNRNR